MKYLIPVLLAAIIVISCNKNKMENTCCKTPALYENYSEGYIAATNLFTPDGDGIDDVFSAYTKGVTNYQITIKNGNGRKVFISSNPDEYWNGYFNGIVKEGIYKVKISLTTFYGSDKDYKFDLCLVKNENAHCYSNSSNCGTASRWRATKREWDFTPTEGYLETCD